MALVDDHHIFREGVVSILNHYPEFEIVGQGSTSADAVRIAQDLQPRLLLLDVEIDEIPTPVTIRQVLRIAPEISIVVLTMHRDRVLREELLGLGATAFLSKTARMAEMIGVLRAAATTKPKQSAQKLIRGEQPALLSTRELEVLRLVAHGYTNREIARWLTIAEGTVKRHTSNIFIKLGARSRMDAVARGRRLGIIGM